MAAFFRKNQDLLLIAFTVLLFGIVGGAYLWGTRTILDSVTKSLAPIDETATRVEVSVDQARDILQERTGAQ
jgi:hypothetical protein